MAKTKQWKPKPPPERRTARLVVQLLPSELEHLQAAAEQAEVTVSEAVRQALVEVGLLPGGEA
jgi:hypothetical protein